jgi:hypothetical protein
MWGNEFIIHNLSLVHFLFALYYTMVLINSEKLSGFKP